MLEGQSSANWFIIFMRGCGSARITKFNSFIINVTTPSLPLDLLITTSTSFSVAIAAIGLVSANAIYPGLSSSIMVTLV